MESEMELTNGGIAAANKHRRGSWTLAQKREAVAESHVAGANVAERGVYRNVPKVAVSCG
jgi:hypothetical protein